MSGHYSQQTAAHYSAYRPPLHQLILGRVLSEDHYFCTGLDVGCGTGTSTIALKEYCSKVIGIDSSEAMLDRASNHSGIKYMTGSGEDIPLPKNSVDIVTFAGSLFYMNLHMVARELQRVCTQDAFIISYDFKILLDTILENFKIKKEERNTEYEYEINFSGVHTFEEVTSKKEKVELNLSPSELAHILLSDSFLFRAFSKKYSLDQPFEKLKNEIEKIDNHLSVHAEIFYSVYQFI